jgi:hypothetical protein
MGWLNRPSCVGRFASMALLAGAAISLVRPGSAGGAEVVTASPPTAQAWTLEVGGSYAATTDFGGWGIALRGGWLANPYLVVGVGIETTRLHAEGSITEDALGPGQPYSQTFQSTFPAAFVRGQVPFRLLTPYTEVATGFVVVHGQRAENTQCSFGSGPGGGIAVGVDARIAPSITVGLRAEARNSGWGGGCLAIGGPWSFQMQDDFMMRSLGLTTRFRW